MVTLESLAEFFGWCTVINAVLLMLAGLFLSVARTWVVGIHTKMFGINESELPGAYFQYLANYKLAVLVFNLVPYAALKMMG